MTEQPRKRKPSHGYRLAVPISGEALKIIDSLSVKEWCTRTEAARWMLQAAAQLYARGHLKVGE